MVLEILADRLEVLPVTEAPGDDEALGSREPALVVVVAISSTVARNLVDQQVLEGAPVIVAGAVHCIDHGEDARLPRFVERAFSAGSCRFLPIIRHPSLSTKAHDHQPNAIGSGNPHRPAGVVPQALRAYPR